MEAKTQKELTIMLAVAGALGGIVTLISYIESKKHKALQLELMKIDKEIKSLDLASKRRVASER